MPMSRGCDLTSHIVRFFVDGVILKVLRGTHLDLQPWGKFCMWIDSSFPQSAMWICAWAVGLVWPFSKVAYFVFIVQTLVENI